MLLDNLLEKGGLLDKLCSLPGPTGYEGEVRAFIKDQVAPYVDEIKCDRLGNIIVHKKGNGKKVLIDAHMDEVGFIVTGFNEDGTLRFRSLGGINDKIIQSNWCKKNTGSNWRKTYTSSKQRRKRKGFNL